MPKPPHVAWLVNTKKSITTDAGAIVDVWELKHVDDPKILSAWAGHFRQHYCSDEILDGLVAGTGLTRSEFLRLHKFPNAKTAPGPSTRSGDFAEILVSDFIEFIQGYWCPRERFSLKWNPNESTKGSDVIGFRFASKEKTSPGDAMYVLESKADMTGANTNKLQEAVDDSAKDPIRHAASLNALKQRFLERDENESAAKIARFQDATDRPYQFLSGAVLVCSTEVFDEARIKETKHGAHPNSDHLTLIVVKGATLMAFVHALYERAANEA